MIYKNMKPKICYRLNKLLRRCYKSNGTLVLPRNEENELYLTMLNQDGLCSFGADDTTFLMSIEPAGRTHIKNGGYRWLNSLNWDLINSAIAIAALLVAIF